MPIRLTGWDILGFITAIGFVMLCLLVFPARAAPGCLTLAEARASYPAAHLWWRGGEAGKRCWSDQSGRSGVSNPAEPARRATASQGSVPAAAGRRPLIDHPGLGRPNPLKLAKPARDANGNVGHHSGRPLLIEDSPPPRRHAEVIYPPLVIHSGAFVSAWVRPGEMTRWPGVLIDIDEMTAGGPDADACCWPSLESLGLTSFNDRWAPAASGWRMAVLVQ